MTDTRLFAGLVTGAGPRESCGDFGIRIARDGTWFYHGSPIGRLPLVKLFASVLRREADGTYWLVTPAERGRIEVEDAPFVAVEVQARGTGSEQILSFRTNLDDTVDAGENHPLRFATDLQSGEPSPYVTIRAGLEAKILRSTFYHLVELGCERIVDGATVFGFWSKATFFPLQTLTPAP
jgi:hypothetical protein